jgi:hypothetical protein
MMDKAADETDFARRLDEKGRCCGKKPLVYKPRAPLRPVQPFLRH